MPRFRVYQDVIRTNVYLVEAEDKSAAIALVERHREETGRDDDDMHVADYAATTNTVCPQPGGRVEMISSGDDAEKDASLTIDDAEPACDDERFEDEHEDSQFLEEGR